RCDAMGAAASKETAARSTDAASAFFTTTFHSFLPLAEVYQPPTKDKKGNLRVIKEHLVILRAAQEKGPILKDRPLPWPGMGRGVGVGGDGERGGGDYLMKSISR